MTSPIPDSLDARLAWRLAQLQQQRQAVATQLAALDHAIAELEALADPSRYQVPENASGTNEEITLDA